MASFLRTWLIRGAVLAVIAASAFAAYTALHWVSPEQVRAAVLAHLAAHFDESVEVSVGSAHMRLFGGLAVTDLTLTRRGDPHPFLAVPHAVILHDKEKLTRGELAVRKIEFTRPVVRVERRADGTWSVSELAKPGPADKSLPTVLATGATVIVTDRRPNAPPPIAFCDLKLTLVNDPLPAVKVDGRCAAAAADALDADLRVPAGVFSVPVTVSARLNRTSGQLTAQIETAQLEVSPDLAPAMAGVHPKAEAYCRQFSGKVTVKADVTVPGVPGQPVKYDVRVGLVDGRYEDPELPWPLDRLAGTVRLADGKVTVEKMTGKLGTAAAELTLESKADLLCGADAGGGAAVPGVVGVGPRRPPVILAHQFARALGPAGGCDDDPLRAVEERLERFELKVLALSLDNDLFARLAPAAQKIRQRFNPTGAVDVAVRFTRPDGGWRREVDVTPRGLGVEYEHFRYPLTELAGSLKKVNASDGTDEFQADIRATAGGRRISVKGRVAGEGLDPLIDLTITAPDVPIDARLIAALPPKYADALGKLRVTGRGNFHVTLKQDAGVNKLDSTYKVHVYNGQVRYTAFPYPFQQVRGDLTVKVAVVAADRPIRPGEPVGGEPDRDVVELRNFEAVHDGGRVWLSGDSKAVAGTPDRKLTLQIQGENCPIDNDFRAALKAMKIDGVVRTFAPRGEITFGSDVDVWDRGRPAAAPPAVGPTAAVVPAVALLPAEPPFDPATDLKIAFHFRGPSVTPSFFPYDLHQLSGVLRYQGGRVEMLDFAGRHGQSVVKMAAADVRFTGTDGVWANLGPVRVAPLVTDAAFLRALPGSLRTGFEQLNVRGPAELTIDHLVIDAPGEPAKPLVVGPPPSGVVQALHTQSATAGGLAEPALLPRLNTLQPWAFRRPPPDKPLVVTAAGLEPFTRAWQPPPPPDRPSDLANAVIYWNATLRLTGGAFDTGAGWDDVYGSIASEGRFEGTHLGAVVGNLWFDRATVAGQPVVGAKAAYRVRPQQPDPNRPGRYLPPVAEFRDLAGTLFGGTVGGEARVTLTDPVKYRLWLTASGVKLEDVARHHKLGSGELKGLAQADVLLENKLDPRSGRPVLTGTGRVDVPHGRLYNLPVLLELVKVLKGQTPDGVAFDEAHAAFEVLGDRLKVTQLDLLGSAVSLGGSGEMDVAGKDVNFEFYTIWSQTLRRWLATPFGDVAGLVSGGLFKIELTRVDGALTPKAVMLPAVTDPVRAVAERWRTRFARDPAPPPTVRGAPR